MNVILQSTNLQRRLRGTQGPLSSSPTVPSTMQTEQLRTYIWKTLAALFLMRVKPLSWTPSIQRWLIFPVGSLLFCKYAIAPHQLPDPASPCKVD